jgi:hypothetical protein
MSLRDKFKEKVYIAPFLGVIAGICTWIVVFPLDTIRTEKQTTNKSISEILRNRSLRSLYRGITPVIVRTLPSSATGMYAYEYTKKLLE